MIVPIIQYKPEKVTWLGNQNYGKVCAILIKKDKDFNKLNETLSYVTLYGCAARQIVAKNSPVANHVCDCNWEYSPSL